MDCYRQESYRCREWSWGSYPFRVLTLVVSLGNWAREARLAELEADLFLTSLLVMWINRASNHEPNRIHGSLPHSSQRGEFPLSTVKVLKFFKPADIIP